MFYLSNFNGDISRWDVRNVEHMSYMFSYSTFTGDISGWNVGKVENTTGIFDDCPIKDEHKPKFNQI
jgi:hypothetical protein